MIFFLSRSLDTPVLSQNLCNIALYVGLSTNSSIAMHFHTTSLVLHKRACSVTEYLCVATDTTPALTPQAFLPTH